MCILIDLWTLEYLYTHVACTMDSDGKMIILDCILEPVPYCVILKSANKSRIEFYEQRGFGTSERKIFYSCIVFWTVIFWAILQWHNKLLNTLSAEYDLTMKNLMH